MLRVAKGRGAAFTFIGNRALDAIHRVAQNGVAFAEVIKKRGVRFVLGPLSI
jgi:hypothetical protein